MADNNPSTDNQPDEQLEQSPPLPLQQLVVPRIYLEWAHKAACSIETIAKVLTEMTAAKDCQDERPQWWSHRHDGDLLSAIEALAEGIQLRMEEPLDPAFQKEALTDRVARIESMAAARVGENEGEKRLKDDFLTRPGLVPSLRAAHEEHGTVLQVRHGWPRR